MATFKARLMNMQVTKSTKFSIPAHRGVVFCQNNTQWPTFILTPTMNINTSYSVTCKACLINM